MMPIKLFCLKLKYHTEDSFRDRINYVVFISLIDTWRIMEHQQTVLTELTICGADLTIAFQTVLCSQFSCQESGEKKKRKYA